MRYGLISDIHFGFHSGTRVNDVGVNIREQDHYDAAFAAVRALKEQGVDVILDCGDMAEVPAPRKRAILSAIDLVREAEVPYYAVDGNHTSLKSSSDIHLYDIISSECRNFRGFRTPAFDSYTGVSFVPHSYDNDEIREYIKEATHRDTRLFVGHWAADDIPYVGQVARRDLPTGVPIFLGHYHNYRPSRDHSPTYVGSTEKTAWDQWDYPTGVAVYDDQSGEYTRLEIPTRHWINLEANVDNYLDLLTSTDISNRLARLTVAASPAEYNAVDQVACRSYAREMSAVQFSMRRANIENPDVVPTEDVPNRTIEENWKIFVADNKPSGVSANRVVQIGLEALSNGP